MVGRDFELTLGSCSLILLSIGACYIYRNINMEPKSTIPVSPVNLKITEIDTNNDDWWPFIEYTKFDTEDNMYNFWSKTRNK